ncbi:MAG: hypothetical protein AB8C84_00965 [Oligoflexales bacterium]
MKATPRNHHIYHETKPNDPSDNMASIEQSTVLISEKQGYLKYSPLKDNRQEGIRVAFYKRSRKENNNQQKPRLQSGLWFA